MSGISLKDCKLSQKNGYHIGVAFQIYDDILDYTFKINDIYKSVLLDLKKGVYTLPLILAYHKDTKAFEDLLKKESKINDFEIEQVTKLINYYNGIQDVKKIMKKYINKVRSEIKQLNSSEIQLKIIELLKGVGME